MKSLSAKILSFLIQFIHSNINHANFSSLSESYIRSLPKELLKFNSFVIERNQKIMKRYNQKVKENLLAIQCPDCYQKKLFIDSQLTCLFCNYTNNPEVLASEYNRTYNPEDQTLLKCTCCQSNSLVKSEGKIICLSCHKEIDAQKEPSPTLH